MAEETLTTNAKDHHDAFEDGETTVPWALSVFSHHVRGVRRICRTAWPVLSHGQIRVSTVGELRVLGYDVLRDGKKGHCLIPLDPPPWDWTALRDVGFGPAQPNPEKLRRQRREAQ